MNIYFQKKEKKQWFISPLYLSRNYKSNNNESNFRKKKKKNNSNTQRNRNISIRRIERGTGKKRAAEK